MKTFLNATLLLASAYVLFLGGVWGSAVYQKPSDMTANSVGVFLGVEENEVNRIVAMIDSKERELREREEVLARTASSESTLPLYAFSLIGIGLFGLILLNFYLDFKRRQSLPN